MRLKGPYNTTASNDGVDPCSSNDVVPFHTTEGDDDDVTQGQCTLLAKGE